MTDTSKGKQRIVVVGGGTGSYTLLRGLKRYADRLDITAIVTMADSGGATGRLRDEFGQLPIGDVRQALAALSADVDDHDELLRQLFLYRFDKGNGLSGHTFGNLLLAALTEILGSEVKAIETASKILRVRGSVVPVTTDNVHLQAKYDDGLVIVGEHEIDEPAPERNNNRIVELSVTPSAQLNKAAEAALLQADIIVLGPGDLYTSILANCVVDGFTQALTNSKAKLVYVCNLMSKTGQTTGMHAKEHVSEIARYAGKMPEFVFYNTTPFPAELLAKYKEEEVHQIENNYESKEPFLYLGDYVGSEEVKTVAGDVLKRSLIRHDSDKLSKAIFNLLS